MTTNVPQPTFGPTGFVVPTSAAVLAGVQADITAAFGTALNYNLNTPQGQLSSSWGAIIYNAYSTFQFYTTQFDPAYATGRWQDAIGNIYLIQRNPSVPTALQINCQGLTNTSIPLGATIQDSSGNLYQCTGSGTIPVGGAITLSFACTVPGPVAVPSASGVSIYQAISGWDSVTVVSGAAGLNQESRLDFELRRQSTVAGNSLGSIGAIIGAVAKVPNIIDYYGTTNPTASPITVGGQTIGAYSIYICAAGATNLTIAQAILSKKSPGAPMTGNTTVTAYDSNPLYITPIAYTIIYQVPAALQVLFKVSIANNVAVPFNATTLVQNALISAFAGNDGGPRARIGSVLYGLRYVSPVAALGSWASVTALTIGSQNTSDATGFGHLNGQTLTMTSVPTGSIAVGQTLFDPLNLIAIGTNITAFGTGAGGTGTYTINNPQVIGGATFNANGTGTGMLTTGVNGTINIGDVITNGTGITAGTLIVAQVTGSAGGAGVYTVNQNLHLPTPVSATTNRPITFASADQTLVSVQINQIPQLNASNIVVVLV